MGLSRILSKAKSKVEKAYREVLDRYVPALEKKIEGVYDKNVKIYLADLPSYIGGAYQVLADGTKRIILNLKHVLNKPYSHVKRTLGHEVVHNIQNNAGKLSTYNRRSAESEAERSLRGVALEVGDYQVAHEIDANSPYLLETIGNGLSRCVKSILGFGKGSYFF